MFVLKAWISIQGKYLKQYNTFSLDEKYNYSVSIYYKLKI